MKKSLLALALAAATLPFTFAQDTAAPSQTSPDQTKSTTKHVRKAKKKHNMKKTTTGSTSTTTTSTPPQK
jgi:hypothetical protein